jgi:hypothetical protein
MSELGPVLLFPAFGVLILLFAAGQALHRLFRASREKTAQERSLEPGSTRACARARCSWRTSQRSKLRAIA